MKTILAIGIAGAFGALARTLLVILVPVSGGFPVGTFVANIAGTFILCFLVEKTLQWTLVNKTTYDAITVGFLGAFTTFSSFGYETFTLLQTDIGMAFLYGGSSLVIGLLAGAFGFSLGGRRQNT
ncbi:CrcB family protein [Sporosarcina sp. BI001-red]|uniref:fluoride efflux transporter FluC n=1 Tax=Sporosarcina sp. BI001-red TaxID=2282866 RepID=UPI000E231D61|nr:CrcB family protein [Sporosarcina sp. BI001-red]REB06392.1 CrcB family protein [Sporosarcina sp. BI001-red]